MAEETTNSDDIAGQSKLYDKIVKENMREVLPMLVKDILGINIISREDLPESLQHTRERTPDQLSKITDDYGETYILHIEWQSKDDPSMDNRMLNIKEILRRIKQQADGEINFQRYKEQLRALIQLRKLGKEFKIAMGTITKFKVEKDPFYQDGVKIGRKKGRREEALEIAHEMKKDKFPVEKIAKFTKLSVEEIVSL